MVNNERKASHGVDLFGSAPRLATETALDALEALVTADENQCIVMINAAALDLFGCSADYALGAALSRFMIFTPLATSEHAVVAFPTAPSVHLAGVQPDRPPAPNPPTLGEMASHSLTHWAVTVLRVDGLAVAAEASVCALESAHSLGARQLYAVVLCRLDKAPRGHASVETITARMRDIFNLAPTAIWITEDDLIVFANRACASLFGAADHQLLLGRSIYSLLRPESHAAVRQSVVRAFTTEAPLPVVSERIARLDGTERDVEIALAAMPDQGRTTLQMVINDVTEKTQANRELQRSRRGLRLLTASLVEAREEERRRIARELHDELGQRLTVLKMALSNLVSGSRAVLPAERVSAMFAMVDDTVAAVRRIATELRPAMLDDIGLSAAIEWLAQESARRMGVEVRWQLPASDPPISDAASIALYRMVQEMLTNVARHAQATEVRIELRCDEVSVVLKVQDNGVGFSAASMRRRGSHGLMGMRERCHMLGGRIELGNAPEGGARITVSLPLLTLNLEGQAGDLDPLTTPAAAAGSEFGELTLNNPKLAR